MVSAYLGLGGNLGNREAIMGRAIKALTSSPSVTVTAVSSLYETPPWGPIPQGAYLNACIGVETSLSARALLALCRSIEETEGRERLVRWGPRTLDIDLLLYGQETIDELGLIVPHPRMVQRAFVLIPLAEIAPDIRIDDVPIKTLISRVDTSGIVKRETDWQR
ncbi:2-amino-4-hydroxy-6-hydroxymethyldihydropteridine diphosphokinase [Kaistia dalseonensis]|uniref:2-amino-4-hydroxy-6-hydroxymethyldihydropteridine pyrophosphokinase n=1 Tax=Kaistia dalseonensis TaxID=410840 RepID=A0ABU0H134_9HYPH|nr:2-amino-4-hydroxy-6-hydroxymethyldihydropteridine diphosphokinase [Kaistia dalseonensis]MCX5493452.1 2-amino-4-hydroxy-6-hydroxymethyldihydropteridine diphosphokinase [Kaistia dalseonensis]MDQ0436011.1 2-amino-4-hydroxy-6-hydroxymethyldihydropteridine diphosphokinase [Kaistia dalseonensis]